MAFLHFLDSSGWILWETGAEILPREGFEFVLEVTVVLRHGVEGWRCGGSAGTPQPRRKGMECNDLLYLIS